MNQRLCRVGAILLGIGALAEAGPPPLEANDVSWLWPPPQLDADVARTLSIANVKSATGTPVWSDSQFTDLLAAADQTVVEGIRIKLSAALRSQAVWRLAALRVDPSAPGCSDEIRTALGSTPQIRLILQPVTASTTPNGAPRVHDFAVHLVYSFVAGLDPENRPLPDRAKFLEIVAGLDHLKQLSAAGGAPTSGKPLGVHPGLRKRVPGLVEEVEKFLSQHLASERLTAIALMGVRPPEPWIFVALAKLPNDPEHFRPVPFLPAQMLSFVGGKQGAVVPLIPTSNRSPISNARNLPTAERRGVATAALFGMPPSALGDLAEIGRDATGTPIKDATLKNREIPDLVAHPALAHFFNTDCVSCHTETRRRMRLSLPPSSVAFQVGGRPPRIATKIPPQDDWNVRNLGWFQPDPIIGGGQAVATATQRTANETAEVVEFIERHYRGDP